MLLGSRSRETRLQAGDRLAAASGTVAFRRLAVELPDTGSLRIIDGPDADALPDAAALEMESGFRVGRDADRTGLRLEGRPIVGPTECEAGRISAPVAPGALQLAGGRLIILGVNCGTMGGYPHVGHIINADLDRVAQLRPGDPVRFRRVLLGEARALDQNRRQEQFALLRRLAAFTGDPGAAPV